MLTRLKFILLVAVLVSATGCSLLNKEELKKELPEIMQMRDCGLDRLQCCDTEPSCFYAQECCVDPNNNTRNYCADKCTTGGEDEFCNLSEPKCQTGFDCYQGNCRKCGEEEESCCSGATKCDIDLICSQNECVRCGLIGNPCCQSGKGCVNEGIENKERAECIDDICELCGFGGKKPCPSEPACTSGHLYNNNFCLVCGEANQPCCDSSTGFDCNPKNNLKCELGFCIEKIKQ
jgi:hypothetical protein